ncbi:MAG: heavy metal-associated domain-containing protein [Bacteroidota bacterium]
MRSMKLLCIVVLFFSVFFFSCNTSKKENEIIEDETATKQIVENFKKIEVEIDGMTCEIGCAKLIESKLSKTEGIKYVKVDFEEKTGRIEYDLSKINEKGITNVIQNIAGGDLYKVVKIENVDKFSTLHLK